MAAEREIKTTLKIDDSNFREGLAASTRSLKTMASELKLNTAEFDLHGASMDNLTKRQFILNKEIDQQKEHIKALNYALEESARKYGDTHENTDKYRDQLVKANTALTVMETDLDKTNKSINDFGKWTKNADGSTKKWVESLQKISSALGKGLVTAAKGAAVAVGTVSVAAGAAAIKLGKEVIRQFGELEQNLGGSEAVFGKFAQAVQKEGEQAYKNMGTSQSDYLATANKMGALFQGSGLSQQKSLELTTQAMQRAADMASVMGIDTQVALDSVAGAAKGNFTMMDNLGVAMNATTIEAYALSKGLDFTWKSATQAQKAEVAMQMFFENTQQYAGNFARESTQTITGSIGMMKAALSSWTAGLGNANADMTSLTGNMVDAFQAVVANITPVLQNIITALPAAIAVIMDSLGAMLPQLLETVTGIFTQVLTMLVSMLPELTPVAIDALLTIVQAITQNLPMILEAANQIIMGLISGIATALPQIMPAAVQGMMMFIQGIVQALPQIINAGMQMLTSLIQGITQALPQIIPAAVEGVMAMVQGILDNLPAILKAGLDLVVALVKGLVNAIPKIIQAMPKIIEAVITYVTTSLPEIIAAGIEITIALIGGLIKAIPQIIAAMPQIIIGIVSGLMNGLAKIGEVGVNLVKGLWEGIKSATQWLWDKLTGWIGDALGWLGKLLGIKSPSRVMADMIGKPMVQGLAKGITDNAGLVGKAMGKLMPDAGLVLDVTRRFNNVGAGNIAMGGSGSARVALDSGSILQLADALAARVMGHDQGDIVLVLNDREMGRYVRGGMAAGFV
ncbi:MAG: phage tail protein [Clostridiales bacterium]|nr:phage tail protein [Clostridiales bacterium]